MNKEELLTKAQNLHYSLLKLEDYNDGEYTEEMFDMCMELTTIMRNFIHKDFHKSYYDIPETKDFYGGSKTQVELDPDIAEAIKIFNAKGYITIASCAGHTVDLENGGTARGYIWMKNIPIEPMLDGIYIDGDDDRKSLRWDAKTVSQLKNCHKNLLRYANKVASK